MRLCQVGLSPAGRFMLLVPALLGGWAFKADHEEDLEDPTLPQFPATRHHLPKTNIEEKILLAEYLFDEGEESHGPYAWIEHQWAQSIIAAVIVLNAALFGLETDIQSPIWVWVEHAILIIFAGESPPWLQLRARGTCELQATGALGPPASEREPDRR
ncbi:unnamed protein product [Effrenium voratum]|uniref:Uncharacterized protein n=1 Tax=Effrenium voratum TaxID=2562239 RepID=A0AA36N0A1_9DINO|nr:unnamed protein product [Effrenium voratum]CAJ1446177.1 unnamed protein product [Effrenium voratum]